MGEIFGELCRVGGRRRRFAISSGKMGTASGGRAVGSGLPSISTWEGGGDASVFLHARYQNSHRLTLGASTPVTEQPNPTRRVGCQNHGREGRLRNSEQPRARVFPQLDSACVARRIFPDPVTRGQSDMGRASAAGAVAHFCALGHVTLLTSFVFPCTRSRY